MEMQIEDMSQFEKNWYDEDFPEQMVRDKIGRIKGWQVTKSKWLPNNSIEIEYMVNAESTDKKVFTEEDILKIFHWSSFSKSEDGLYVKYTKDESWFVCAPKKRRRKIAAEAINENQTIEVAETSKVDDNEDDELDNLNEEQETIQDSSTEFVDDEEDFENVVGNLERADAEFVAENPEVDDDDDEEI